MLTARKYEDMHESQIVLLLCSSYMHHCGGSFFMFSYAGPWGHLTRSIHAIQGRDCHAWSPQRVPFEGEAAKACYCEGLYWLWQTKWKLIEGGKYAALWIWWNDLQELRLETSPFEQHFSVHNITWWMCLSQMRQATYQWCCQGAPAWSFAVTCNLLEFCPPKERVKHWTHIPDLLTSFLRLWVFFHEFICLLAIGLLGPFSHIHLLIKKGSLLKKQLHLLEGICIDSYTNKLTGYKPQTTQLAQQEHRYNK